MHVLRAHLARSPCARHQLFVWPKTTRSLHALSVSGNADGLGNMRRDELGRSLDVLGVPSSRRWVEDRSRALFTCCSPFFCAPSSAARVDRRHRGEA
ncbi:uncharacterized protein B0H18DRAFT_985248 [Fomitopsis serialis]|uniref:uncharacterized protein n=1 Tax=Fomitopsis serialis TaxID=139415 RepID=UPI0020086424|nr:uncharacterized protein B0H18DRAFT_985248 [Neoantrodia serialis]KAH9933038.1 hypothetical protein B0H18DRAFT_985248 [Neoantrodia serialis]